MKRFVRLTIQYVWRMSFVRSALRRHSQFHSFARSWPDRDIREQARKSATGQALINSAQEVVEMRDRPIERILECRFDLQLLQVMEGSLGDPGPDGDRRDTGAPACTR